MSVRARLPKPVRGRTLRAAGRLLRYAGRFVATPRGLAWAAGALALSLVALFGGRTLDHHLAAIEAWLGTLGPGGTLALIPLYVLLTCCLFPDSLLRVTAGAIFGMSWGVAGVALGTLLGSLAQFALGRLLAPRIERLVAARPSRRAMQRAMLRDGLRLQLLVRLTPINHAAVSYALAAAGVRLGPFLAALPALLPSLFLEVWVGHAGRHAAEIAEPGGRDFGIADLAPFAGIAIGAVAIVAASRAAHRAVTRAMEAGEAERTSTIVRPTERAELAHLEQQERGAPAEHQEPEQRLHAGDEP